MFAMRCMYINLSLAAIPTAHASTDTVLMSDETVIKSIPKRDCSTKKTRGNTLFFRTRQ